MSLLQSLSSSSSHTTRIASYHHSWTVGLVLVLFHVVSGPAAVLVQAQEQEVGVTLCACQPTIWEFTLDLTNPCPPQYNGNIPIDDDDDATKTYDDSDAIVVDMWQEHACFEPILEPGIVDDINFDTQYPSQGIDSIYVLELDQTLETLSQYTVPGGPFVSGDSFTYESILMTSTAAFNTTSLPRALVLIFAGFNALGQRITASWSVEFDNSCQPFVATQPPLSAGGAGRPPLPEETETLLTTINYSFGPPSPYCPLGDSSAAPTPAAPTTASPTRAAPSQNPAVLPGTITNAPTTAEPTTAEPTTAEPTTAEPTTAQPTTPPTMDDDNNNNQDDCACQPAAWEFELCLDCACPIPPALAFGPDGVQQQVCVVGGEGGGGGGANHNNNNRNNGHDEDIEIEMDTWVDHTTMTRVDRILILELSQDLVALTQYKVPGAPFFNGDVIHYQSIQLERLLQQQQEEEEEKETTVPTAGDYNRNLGWPRPPNHGSSSNGDELPGGIVVAMTGPNKHGVLIESSWSIQFTNQCNVFPVIVGGEVTVNTIVKQVTDPPQSVCPLAPAATPTTVPTTFAPTSKPVAARTAKPTTDCHNKGKKDMMGRTTMAPSWYPTSKPTFQPVPRPPPSKPTPKTVAPTWYPTSKPTFQPVPRPPPSKPTPKTVAPTFHPTDCVDRMPKGKKESGDGGSQPSLYTKYSHSRSRSSSKEGKGKGRGKGYYRDLRRRKQVPEDAYYYPYESKKQMETDHYPSSMRSKENLCPED